MTIEEIESACEAGRALDFSRHPIAVPELSLQKMFYPLGFPVEAKTNSAEILKSLGEMWGMFQRRFATETIRVDVHVVDSGSTECPPAPTCRHVLPFVFNIADGSNYSISDLTKNWTRIVLSRAAVQNMLYRKHFFLNASPLSHVATRFTTPIHAGCVSLNGKGVLLCGDSGAGKSSLSYACARAGWTYITDDASYLLNGGDGRTVTGDCHHVRLRPTAADLFPEINGMKITPRAAGKPSIILATAELPQLICEPTARVDYMVFLNRRASGRPKLHSYSKDVARNFIRQVQYGTPESLAAQYREIERLLKVEVLELCYTDMDWAIQRLKKLAREGS
jgi:hypothetical protein